MTDPLCDGCSQPIIVGDDEHQSPDKRRLFHAECCFQAPSDCGLLHPGDADYYDPLNGHYDGHEA